MEKSNQKTHGNNPLYSSFKLFFAFMLLVDHSRLSAQEKSPVSCSSLVNATTTSHNKSPLRALHTNEAKEIITVYVRGQINKLGERGFAKRYEDSHGMLALADELSSVTNSIPKIFEVVSNPNVLRAIYFTSMSWELFNGTRAQLAMFVNGFFNATQRIRRANGQFVFRLENGELFPIYDEEGFKKFASYFFSGDEEKAANVAAAVLTPDDLERLKWDKAYFASTGVPTNRMWKQNSQEGHDDTEKSRQKADETIEDSRKRIERNDKAIADSRKSIKRADELLEDFREERKNTDKAIADSQKSITSLEQMEEKLFHPSFHVHDLLYQIFRTDAFVDFLEGQNIDFSGARRSKGIDFPEVKFDLLTQEQQKNFTPNEEGNVRRELDHVMISHIETGPSVILLIRFSFDLRDVNEFLNDLSIINLLFPEPEYSKNGFLGGFIFPKEKVEEIKSEALNKADKSGLFLVGIETEPEDNHLIKEPYLSCLNSEKFQPVRF